MQLMHVLLMSFGFGVITAAILAIAAVGLSLQFGVTNYINFAYGDLLTFGVYIATGYKDIKAGIKINYDGASGPMDFNAHNNVFGGFDAVQSDASGNVNIVTTISANDLNGY